METDSKRSSALSDLIRLSESALQARIIEPLLRAMGFTDVRDHSGSFEKGKDLIALKKSEFGRTLLYGIQLKKLNVNARVTSSNALGALLIQLKQAKEEQVVDPETNERRQPDSCIFITPYSIAPDAWERFLQAAQDARRLNIELVDGPRILDLIDRFAPHLINEFSMEVQYRRRLSHELNRVPEARVAFGLTSDIELDNIYVDTSVRSSDDILLELAKYPLLKEGPKMFVAKRSYLNRLQTESLGWKAQPEITDPPVPRSESEIERLKTLREWAKNGRGNEVFQVNIDPVFLAVQKEVRHTLASLSALSGSPSVRDLTVSLHRVVLLKSKVVNFLKVVNEYWPQIVDRSGKVDWDYRLIALETRSVLDADINLHILGEPGSGKTTLLRRFTQILAKDRDDVLPIYLPLVRVSNPTSNGILEACLQQLNSFHHRSVSKTVTKQQDRQFRHDLLVGKLRLFLDGLDETGPAAQKLLTSMKELTERFPKTRIVVSSRYDFAGNRLHGAAELRLAPFNDGQLKKFITQWFRSEPSAREKISAWLKRNRRMRDAARNPLIAALLCSLFDAGTNMPNTEVDLYRERFDLLLGRWERAKGILPLRPQRQRRYWRFITELAFDTHNREQRLIEFADAVELADRYHDSKYHRDPSAFVMDCVHRGIFELEPNGSLSFGHFSYQEYLAACWLADHVDLPFILRKLDSEWWWRVFYFWAAIKEDITNLLKCALSDEGMSTLQYRNLWDLTKAAKYTNSGVIEELAEMAG